MLFYYTKTLTLQVTTSWKRTTNTQTSSPAKDQWMFTNWPPVNHIHPAGGGTHNLNHQMVQVARSTLSPSPPLHSWSHKKPTYTNQNLKQNKRDFIKHLTHPHKPWKWHQQDKQSMYHHPPPSPPPPPHHHHHVSRQSHQILTPS